MKYEEIPTLKKREWGIRPYVRAIGGGGTYALLDKIPTRKIGV